MGNKDDQAQAIARLHPGIEMSRFAVKMGWDWQNRMDRNGEALAAINDMEARGIIAIAPADRTFTEARVFLPGALPRSKPSAKKVQGSTCKVWVDPKLKGAYSPQEYAKERDRLRRQREEQQRQQEELMRSGYERILEVLDEMKAAGVIWTRTEVCARAGVADNYMSPARDSNASVDARVAYDKVVVEIEAANPQKATSPTVDRLTQLERENEQLKREMEALKGTAVQYATPIQYLQQEAAHWRQAIARLEGEVQEARVNLAACERLLGLQDGAINRPDGKVEVTA